MGQSRPVNSQFRIGSIMVLDVTQFVAGSFTCASFLRGKLSMYETRKKDGMWWASWWRKKLLRLFWIQLQGMSPSAACIGVKRKAVAEFMEAVPYTVDEGFNPFVRLHALLVCDG